jgi:hypothetical protein
MPRTKRKPNQNQLKKAASVAGVVGASMALGGGAYATGVANSSPDVSARDTALGPQINLSEEELSDVSLGTFYVFDKEDLSMAGARYAARCGRCGRCGGAGRCGGRCAAVARCARCGGCSGCAVGGCRACRACAGCSGCSCGCCVSWGACRFIC